jgi:hypothetical protein
MIETAVILLLAIFMIVSVVAFKMVNDDDL